MKTVVLENEKYDFFSKENVNVNSCGFQNNSDYSIIRRNGRSDYHLLYVYSGYCKALYDTKTYTLLPGNFVMYYPGQTQKYTFENKCCTTLWLHFSGSAIDEILNDLKLSAGVYNCTPSEKVSSVFKELVQEFNAKRNKNKFLENSLLIYLLANVSGHVHDEHTANGIDKVIMMMHSNYSAEYEPDVYAEMCSLSISRFSHKFKEITGKPPLKYFIDIKIEKSKELLAFSNLKISDVSEMIGYDNPFYFSRLFKKSTGLSPVEYRKKYKQSNFDI